MDWNRITSLFAVRIIRIGLAIIINIIAVAGNMKTAVEVVEFIIIAGHIIIIQVGVGGQARPPEAR